jgi:VIT1/CCC1 family predicted Fe2+/Mn2+ transporter
MPSRGNETRAELEAVHTPEAISERLDTAPARSYLSDFIYGAIDGAVTTFAVVSGVAGAQLARGIGVGRGAANLGGGGFSMAAANFLGTRAEGQQRLRARRTEAHEIRVHPEGEREEIRQIFARKGFEGEVLEQVVEVITADEQRWLDTMMSEEHGLAPAPRSPIRAATATLVAFIVIGAIPLLPYVGDVTGLVDLPAPFGISAVLTAVAFFLVGAAKSRFVDQRWWLAGLETLFVGGIAAVLAYGMGVLLRGLA